MISDLNESNSSLRMKQILVDLLRFDSFFVDFSFYCLSWFDSFFGYFFNEYSSNLIMFRKASKCQHKFSCMEYLINKFFKYAVISLALKYPLKFIFNYYLFLRNSFNVVLKFL